MRARKALLLAPLLVLASASLLLAQDEDAKPDDSTTYQGLSGLFQIISPDTLDRGQVSFGLVHRNYDRELSDLDVNDSAAVFGLGLTDRMEFGFSYAGNRQMDFDDPRSPAYYNGFPVRIPTIENGGGDLWLGFKYALARIQDRGAGLALYGKVKVPTGDEDQGRSSGGADVTMGAAGGLISGQAALYFNAGYTLAGDYDGQFGRLDLADSVTYGVGLQVGARHWFKAIAELLGETYVNDKTRFVVNGAARNQEPSADLALGFKLGGAQHSGFTLGAAWTRNLSMDRRRESDGGLASPQGFIVELGYTSSEKPLPPPPVPAEAQVNHPPSCTLTLSPREVYPSYSSKVNRATATAVATDPDGDTLSYAWSATGGTLSGRGASVEWSPPEGIDQGSFRVAVRVSDGHGGEADCSDSVTVKPDPEHFEGRVQFEFDRYDLSEEARQVIARAVEHMKRNPDLKVTVEGHCCYIATEEYNLQLGQQRAEAIKAHMLSLGASGVRLGTISYGETRPWQDNSREITRRLNRRGEFRFRFSE